LTNLRSERKALDTKLEETKKNVEEQVKAYDDNFSEYLNNRRKVDIRDAGSETAYSKIVDEAIGDRLSEAAKESKDDKEMSEETKNALKQSRAHNMEFRSYMEEQSEAIKADKNAKELIDKIDDLSKKYAGVMTEENLGRVDSLFSIAETAVNVITSIVSDDDKDKEEKETWKDKLNEVKNKCDELNKTINGAPKSDTNEAGADAGNDSEKQEEKEQHVVEQIAEIGGLCSDIVNGVSKKLGTLRKEAEEATRQHHLNNVGLEQTINNIEQNRTPGKSYYETAVDEIGKLEENQVREFEARREILQESLDKAPDFLNSEKKKLEDAKASLTA
jgi:hypothetical protein